MENLKYEALEGFVKSLYKRLSGSDDEPLGTINFHNFDLRNGYLYYKDNVNPLTTKQWVLRGVGVLTDRLGKEGLRCDVCCDMLYMYDITSSKNTWILDMCNNVLCNTTGRRRPPC